MPKGMSGYRLNRTPKSEIKCPRCGGHYVTVDKSGEGDTWVARCTQCLKRWPYEQKHFQGETMTCALCGKQRQSDPAVESDWRLLQLDGRDHYVCTDHFPPDGAPKEAFSQAYQTIIGNLASRQD